MVLDKERADIYGTFSMIFRVRDLGIFNKLGGVGESWVTHVNYVRTFCRT